MATKKAAWTPASGKVGRNASYSVDDKGVMTITVDLNIRLGPSASGKTMIIATTEGNKSIEGGAGAVIGMNIYTKEGVK
jgi:ABC-type polar amino acid transport system ATPase subunit